MKHAFQDAWTNAKKDGLEVLIKEKLPKVDEKKVADLMTILERHFDPEKKPKGRSQERRGARSRTTEKKINDDKENNNKSDSGHDSPDTTTSGSPVKMNGDSDEIKAQECAVVVNECAERV